MDWAKEPELSFDPSIHQKDLCLAWTKFIETGEIEGDIVPSYIAESWKRSRERNLDPFHFSPSAYLDPEIYEKKRSEQQYLTSIAKPFMENIYRSLEQSRYLVVLYNSEGYHLLRIGQRADFERSSQFTIREGLCFGEEKVGTCGFSLVKWLKKPIQIIGCEHYSALLHYVVGSYAPINDPIRGDLIGVLGVTGARTIPNPHTLGIAIAASTAIENYIKLDHARKILSVYGKALQTTMDSLADGIVLIDSGGRIYEINTSAKEIFGLTNAEVKGRHISDVHPLADLESLIMNVLRYQDREGQEIDIHIQNQVYLTKIQFARGEKDDVQGVIVQLKNLKNLSQIVYHLTGGYTQFTFDTMIGSSPKSLEIKALARLAAQSDTSIIIEGESGTGKEVLAQAIHNASPRAKEPFVVINCSAIPSELMESILFGHEKGAFTGATHTHIGKFELADRGTVFLDEIAEMPLNMQAKLLRVLEEHKVERVGGKKSISINLRVITATNRDLAKEIKENRFREDLFYRLNVFRIKLPPLRERKQEIYELVPIFVQQISSLLNKRVEKVSNEYYKILVDYDWPGNIRELRNAVQYSIATLDGPILLEKHLAGFFNQVSQQIKKEERLWPINTPFPSKLSDLEKIAIQNSLLLAKGNKMKAAKLLGIGRATLHRKLKNIN
ncbi:MAG: sigma 54-interacting transcriptional regulator [Thermodesulfobacteriota bacterium]|nr:sigma 54-interacting transcriptional regulator [Thermodesulfobacteriota bacterium]